MTENPFPTPQSRAKVPGQESPFSRTLTIVGKESESYNIQETIPLPLEPSKDASGLHHTFVVRKADLYQFALNLLKKFEEPKTKKRG